MNKNDRNEAKRLIIAAITGAVEKKLDLMLDYLAESFDAVEADDHGNKSASTQIPVKLRLTRSARLGDTYQARVIVKKIATEIGEYEMTFNPDQPELNFSRRDDGDDAPADGVDDDDGDDDDSGRLPTEGEFFSRMVTLTAAVKLRKYWAGSRAWKDFSGFAAAEPALIGEIMRDDAARAEFARLVDATLAE